MTLLALVLSTALADPIAAREPLQGDFAIHVGTPETSAVVWFLDDFGVAASLRTDLGAVELTAVERRPLGKPDGWGADLHGAFGFGMGLARPLPYVTAVLALHGGYRGERFGWTIGPAIPFAMTFVGGWTARVPLLVETFVGPRFGNVALGLRGATGTVLSPGIPASFAGQVGLGLTVKR
ncbi:MAG: hypothetical protein EP330_09050 [Deltaproteobacteria bacterium]|nr:MAG: hypothetical protein EP330_09050 [Deltaproteobacteria bacterium]